jgi:serine/threonine-protein kinase
MRERDPRADLNLLLGIIALQMDFITRDALIAAMSAWVLDKCKTLGEILLSQGAIEAADLDALEPMIARHVARHGGEAERSLAAISSVGTVVEDLRSIADPDIDASLSTLPSTSHDDTLTFPASRPGSADRYRKLRDHARGGLGVVYVAHDIELNREVALKEIQTDQADDPSSRTRFVVEAEVTGGLEHPGIVPVYGLGKYDDGRPFYAMRFIKGDSLKNAIDRFHGAETPDRDPGERILSLQKLLRRYLDVCNAVEYAHSRGILHRDLKPGNVMVGKYGETLVVDWGLAKPVSRAGDDGLKLEATLRPSSSDSAETQPGSVVGTPGYMSPEQAAGRIDLMGPASDVYSLGATLYALLTNKPPFSGSDKQVVIRRVQGGTFLRPRVLVPWVDPALEAICLKAMALNPDDRYASPRALAGDIERWIADEPVSAYREPWSRRARRWRRRNRTAVTGGAVAVVALLFGTAAVLAVQTKANADLSQANTALAAAKDREAARFKLAMEAIKLFHGEVGDDLVLKADQFKPLRDKLLKGAADFYGKLDELLKDQPDRASRRAMGNAYFELGELTAKIGDKSAALASHLKGLAIRRELASGPLADAEVRGDVANSLFAIAVLHTQTGNSPEALTLHEEARDLLEGLPQTGPGSVGRRGLLGRVYIEIAGVLAVTGKADAAMTIYKRSVEILAPLVADNPSVTEFRNSLSLSHQNIGILNSWTGKTVEALESYRQSLALRQKLADDNPAIPEFRSRLAKVHHSIGILQSNTGKTVEALESFRQDQAINQKLAADNPAITKFRSDLADSYYAVGVLQSKTGDPEEALESHRRALEHWQKLAADNPAVTDFPWGLAENLYSIGRVQSEIGKTVEALESFRQVEAIYQKLAADNPAITEFRNRLAETQYAIGELQLVNGQQTEAMGSSRRALEIWQKLAADNPAVTGFRWGLAVIQDFIGVLQSQAGHPVEALESSRQSLTIYQKLAADEPAVADYQRYLAVGQTRRADVLRSIGRTAEAREGYERAIATFEELIKAEPNLPGDRAYLALGVRRRGLARLAAGDLGGAAADARKAATLYEGLPSHSAEQWYELACCHAALAGAAGREGSGISAVDGEVEADKAMHSLRQAAASGYRNTAGMTRETALDPLRHRPDFRRMMLDLAFPDDPFAK